MLTSPERIKMAINHIVITKIPDPQLAKFSW